MLRDRRFYLIVPALIGPSFIVTGLFFHQVHLTEAKGWELSWFRHLFRRLCGLVNGGFDHDGCVGRPPRCGQAHADLSPAAVPGVRNPGARQP
jgi:hypothetical protein